MSYFYFVILLMIIGIALMACGLFAFAKGLTLVFKAIYYRWFASAKAVDHKLHSIVQGNVERTEIYDAFEKELESLIK